ncbi:MAG: hypothetical protein AAB307_02300, partial [Deltaproteobacteria bacterium]
GNYPREEFRNWAELEREGLITSDGEGLSLTRKGVLLANEVFLIGCPAPDPARLTGIASGLPAACRVEERATYKR